jgi:hypothetical protein
MSTSQELHLDAALAGLSAVAENSKLLGCFTQKIGK